MTAIGIPIVPKKKKKESVLFGHFQNSCQWLLQRSEKMGLVKFTTRNYFCREREDRLGLILFRKRFFHNLSQSAADFARWKPKSR
jgi:hypothetical protein